MSKTKPNTKADKSRKRKGGISDDMRSGSVVSLDFFRRNAWLLSLIVIVLLALMGLRYKTKAKMAEIKTLKTQLERAESSKLQNKSEYMSLVRESEMRRLSDEKGLGLIFQEQPPFELEIKKK